MQTTLAEFSGLYRASTACLARDTPDHAALADERGDLVWAEVRATRERHQFFTGSARRPFQLVELIAYFSRPACQLTTNVKGATLLARVFTRKRCPSAVIA
jgi:hypothetical protein